MSFCVCHLCPVLVVRLVGIYDKHVQHSDLNSSHSVLTEVEAEKCGAELIYSRSNRGHICLVANIDGSRTFS